jgi:DNA-binding protein HU-beta
MNKAQLIDAIAAKADLTKADAKKALDAFIEAHWRSIKSGDRVALVGFGSFQLLKEVQETGRNPQTGKEITIPAKACCKIQTWK